MLYTCSWWSRRFIEVCTPGNITLNLHGIKKCSLPCIKLLKSVTINLSINYQGRLPFHWVSYSSVAISVLQKKENS